MAYLKLHRVGSQAQVNILLQGGIMGGVQLRPQPSQNKTVIFGLHGLTLVFTTPIGTVTFSDPTGAGLTLEDILLQIRTTIATLQPTFVDQRLVVLEATPTNGVALNGAISTAAALFGFPPVSVAGTKYAPEDGTAPRFLWFESNAQMDSLYVITEEP